MPLDSVQCVQWLVFVEKMADLILATDDAGGPEIFASLQGEGPSAGSPTAFIRLSRCNLACVWCDTAYTWRFDDAKPHRDNMAYDRNANQVMLGIEEAAERIIGLGQNRLVITGGEPLLQAGALADLLEAMDARGHAPFVEIETNGTVKLPARLDIRVDQFNVSPKLSHSGNRAELALIEERLDFFASDPRAYFKFVIADSADVDEVLRLVQFHRMACDRTFLMAEGVDSTSLKTRQKWISKACLDHGFRMSDRMHIHLYGDTRAT